MPLLPRFSGSFFPSLKNDMTYTLVCTMDDGSVQIAETTVRVNGSSASVTPSSNLASAQLASALESVLKSLLGILGR